MKLATLKNRNRDGELIVVNRLMTHCITVGEIAPTLQYALDHWNVCQPKLTQIYHQLNEGLLPKTLSFNPQNVSSPLPRAYQWADGSAYLNHVELVRKARGAEMPSQFWTDPLMYQGGSDAFLGPREDILVENEAYGIDFEAEVAVITLDVPMNISVEGAAQKIALLMLVNDVSLRNLVPDELAKGFGFFQSKPSSAFSPVAVTPDELGGLWDGKKLHYPVHIEYNGLRFGNPNAGIDMNFDFPTLIAHAAKTRPLSAGTIIGSGTISNKDQAVGHACIAEKRMVEKLSEGKSTTPFMQFGDEVKIEMVDGEGISIFGAIQQQVKPYSV